MDEKTELQIRSQAAYQATGQRLVAAIEAIASLEGEVAVQRAKNEELQKTVNDLSAKLLEAQTPKPGE